MTKKHTINPYKILGVSPDASNEQIKEAYRTLMKEHHPDLHLNEEKKKEAENRAKDINGAYEILSDKDKRFIYDSNGSFQASGDPMADFFSRFGTGRGFGDFHFTFVQQTVINVQTEMTLADMLFGNQSFKIQSPVGEIRIEFGPQNEPRPNNQYPNEERQGQE